ncbi:MAG: hypothetical protein NWE82_01600 [Candidatus Bathyarchaeota archaeon]|jgi:hypothetical protein|nr:hypothetical protein [Candidatus Bathyarchaeota archaeon]
MSSWKESKGEVERMPAIASSYIYAFFALISVSSILISAFAAYAATLRTIPETEQLQNLLEFVAAEGCELVALTSTTNSTSRATIQLPSSIGSKQYWVRLGSESTKAWVEGALGEIHEGSVVDRVYLPRAISVSGNYSSSYGPGVLECYMDAATVNLRLSTWRDSV